MRFLGDAPLRLTSSRESEHGCPDLSVRPRNRSCVEILEGRRALSDAHRGIPPFHYLSWSGRKLALRCFTIAWCQSGSILSESGLRPYSCEVYIYIIDILIALC